MRSSARWSKSGSHEPGSCTQAGLLEPLGFLVGPSNFPIYKP